MIRKFDSCSYRELTRCVLVRIDQLREYRRFRGDALALQYPQIRTDIIFKILIREMEIRKLLRMRRILNKSNLNNWNSDVLGPLI